MDEWLPTMKAVDEKVAVIETYVKFFKIAARGPKQTKKII